MLAFRICSIDNNKRIEYDKLQLYDPFVIEDLFQFCKEMKGYISYKGWLFLINHYGYETLFTINKTSMWLNTKSLNSFIADVNYEKDQAFDSEIDSCKYQW